MTALLGSIFPSSSTAKAQEERIILDNVENTAWIVTEDTYSLTQTGEENPEIVLLEGHRYSFGNNGWRARPFDDGGTHPLELRDSNDRPLLSQDGRGRYEDDAEVDWRDDGNVISFTVTERLARELDGYACTSHRDMQGQVRTVREDELEETAEEEPEVVNDDRDDEDSEETRDDEELSGFGVLAGLVGLVGALVWRHR